jgi:hypothetical protein
VPAISAPRELVEHIVTAKPVAKGKRSADGLKDAVKEDGSKESGGQGAKPPARSTAASTTAVAPAGAPTASTANDEGAARPKPFRLKLKRPSEAPSSGEGSALPGAIFGGAATDRDSAPGTDRSKRAGTKKRLLAGRLNGIPEPQVTERGDPSKRGDKERERTERASSKSAVDGRVTDRAARSLATDRPMSKQQQQQQPQASDRTHSVPIHAAKGGAAALVSERGGRRPSAARAAEVPTTVIATTVGTASRKAAGAESSLSPPLRRVNKDKGSRDLAATPSATPMQPRSSPLPVVPLLPVAVAAASSAPRPAKEKEHLRRHDASHARI